jgi:uncharacterized phage protein gp47/JayE
MALNFPANVKEVEQRSRTDVQNTLPESNPFLANSYLDAIIKAQSGRVYDFYLQLEEVIRQLFVDTADGTFLERWGTYVGILRKPATQATGVVAVTGTQGAIIPINTQLTNSVGQVYLTTASATIADQQLQVATLTRVGNTAILETVSEHLLYSGQSVTISGADQNDYNGTFTITVTGTREFTYEVENTPASPATGTILVAATYAPITVRAQDFGESTNQLADTALTFATPLAGVNNTARVTQGGVGGGADQENDEDLRDRILFRYQNPVALFNVAAIITKAQEVPGVTRVFVQTPGTIINSLDVDEITRNDAIATVTTATSHFLEDGQRMIISGADQEEYNITKKVIVIDDVTFAYMVFGAPASPATGDIVCETTIPNGQVIIYFTRDNEENIIPTAQEVAQVKDALVNYNTGIKPAHTDDFDVVVRAPIAVPIDFTFTALSPNSVSMQAAIEANLQAFFRENTTVGTDLLQDAYRSVIYRTIDPETGLSVRSFSLSEPTTDIEMFPGELPILGTVSFIV